MTRRLPREAYTVGWVCALSVELAAAKAMLDEEHEVASIDDDNVYCMGSMAGHNVVIVCLPAGQIGNNPATAVATQMKAAFQGIRFGLMVGIGGGVPSVGPNVELDIRLGDVVVSQPQSSFGGVVQYDLGKFTPQEFERTGSLNAPPQILLSAVNAVKANAFLARSTMSKHLSTLERIPFFQRCRAGPDVLFDASYHHRAGPTCDQCCVDRQQPRQQRQHGAEIAVHYGTIASGNQVIKDAAERDRISAKLGGVLCFEMEAAGLINTFPCLVIRGVCDYADTHKNSRWQPYAAATAAAYAKELLMVIPAAAVMKNPSVDGAMRSGDKRPREPPSPEPAPSKRTIFDPSDSTNHDLSGTRSVQNAGAATENSTDWNRERAVTLPFHRHEQSQPPITEKLKQTLLESLRFDQIDSRQLTIKTAHTKTCRWLLKSPQYLDWLDASKLNDHHGFLWIKGKAGAGKSTLMKLAMLNARKTMKGCNVLSFFFNARGEDIEKSTVGTYRSLLLQLLEAIPDSQNILNSTHIPASAISTDQNWSIELLTTLFDQAIQSLGESSVVCFIDALDECEEQQIREMIQFFEHIAHTAVSSGIRFKVCFSSRHYPHITIRKGIELVLEGQEGHAQDITNFVESELKIGKSKTAQLVRSELQEKASGVFMWVVLVVGILNKEFDRGQVHVLRKKLQEIPSDLHQLFRDILTRDSHNKELLVLCIQMVLFAKQPLSLEQLYHVLLSRVDPDAVSEWDPEDTTTDDMKRYILNSSKGLAETTAAKDPKIQFIHESVRDFLLKENGLSKIWPEFVDNFHGKGHERLKQCCHDYINLAAGFSLEIPLRIFSSQRTADLRKSASRTLPFLEYAIQNVLYHADTAEGSGIPQAEFLASFSIPEWVRYNNLFEKFQLRRHTSKVTLLYLLAEFDMANLAKALDAASQCMELELDRYGCPLFAAAAMGSEKTLAWFMAFIEMHLAPRVSSVVVDREHYQTTSAQGTARRDFVYAKSESLLLNALKLGHDGLFDLLVRSRTFEIDSKDSRERTLLWCASSIGREMAVRSLISAGSATIDGTDKENRSPLYVAAESGHEATMRVLLDNGVNIDMVGGTYYTALQAASARGHKKIVELLLEKGASVNAQGGYYGNALQAASAIGYKEIIRLLLEKGANVNAQGGHYGNALWAASDCGHGRIVELLYRWGAIKPIR